MKLMHGKEVFVQSAGVHHDMEVDPFMVEVAREIGIDLSRHRAKSLGEMEQWGDDMGSYDVVIALSPASQRRALELTRHYSIDVTYWPTLDPTGIGETREQKLDAYRQTRDQLRRAIIATFGPGESDAGQDA